MALCEAVEQLDPQHHADVVGIGLPAGRWMPRPGYRVCINLPGWEEVPLADWLEPRLERRVTLANDGNCAVVGEAWLGAAQGYAHVVAAHSRDRGGEAFCSMDPCSPVTTGRRRSPA